MLSIPDSGQFALIIGSLIMGAKLAE